MAFTEFCCKSGGSNLNAGTRTGNSTEPGTSADFTYASGTWVSATGVFTVASGDPATDGVAVGDFASVYADGSSATGFVGRVTARDATTITVSLTAKAGTAPTDGTGNRTLKVGGAWQGPNAADTFPFNLATLASLTNAAGDVIRINLKNDQSYAMTAVLTSASTGPYIVEGYSSSYGDQGQSTISWASGAFSHTITISGAGSMWRNIIADSTGKAAAGENWNVTGATVLYRCVSKNSTRGGFQVRGVAVECEAYGGAGAVNLPGFRVVNGSIVDRCVARGNTSNGGFALITGGAANRCIAAGNTGVGFDLQDGACALISCDAYANSSDGIRLSNGVAMQVLVENSNLIANGGYGINGTGAGARVGAILNCGFGSGSGAVNTSGTTTGLKGIVESGSVVYGSGLTPWQDPANGDFRIVLTAAKAAGRGSFFQTESGQAGTIGYPDIGAAQALGGNGRPTLPFLQNVIG